MADRKADRDAPLVADLCRRYSEEHLPRKPPRSQAEDRSMIDKYILPALGRLSVEAVRFDDMDQLHRKITRHAPIRANRIVQRCSARCSRSAIRWGWRADSPIKGVERNREERRQRFLLPDEIVRLVRTLTRRPKELAPPCSNSLVDRLSDRRSNSCVVGPDPGRRVDQTGRRDKTGARTSHTTSGAGVVVAGHAAADRAVAVSRIEWQVAPFGPHTMAGGDQASWHPGRANSRSSTHARVNPGQRWYVAADYRSAAWAHSTQYDREILSHLLDDPLRQATERAAAVIAGGDLAEVVPMRRRR